MAVSYRQILLERDGQPLNESQVRLLLRQVLSQLRRYHERQQAHGGVSLSTIQQVPQGCQLLPPTRTPVRATPRQDIVALAQAAITLLTGYPPSPDWLWQEHCEIDPALAQVLTQMLAGAFDQAGQVLAVLVPDEGTATEFDTASCRPPPPTVAPVPLVAPTAPVNLAAGADATVRMPVVLLVFLGFVLGGMVAVGGGLVWWLFVRRPAVVTQPTVAPTGQGGNSGGQKNRTTTALPASFSAEEGVALVASWLEAKKNIFAPPYDLDLAAKFLTGPAWTAVAKRDGSVEWLRKNHTYYRYGPAQVTLKRVLQSDAHRLVIDVYIQQPLRMYQNGRLRQSKIDQDTYRFDLRRVGDTWKIYDRRSL
ncbi:ARC6/PARC6 family protein [Gloeomargarita sp.]